MSQEKRTAAQIAQARARAQSMAANPNRTADDKYYRSANKSAISSIPTTRKGRIGDPLKANITAPDVAGDLDSDKYYASGGSNRQKGVLRQQARRKLQPVVVPARTKAKLQAKGQKNALEFEAEQDNVMVVEHTDQIRIAVDHVTKLLNAGRQKLILKTTPELERDMQAAFDIAVARNKITSTQRDTIRYRRLTANTSPEEFAFGKIDPNRSPRLQANEISATPDSPTDFDAFVKGGKKEPVNKKINALNAPKSSNIPAPPDEAAMLNGSSTPDSNQTASNPESPAAEVQPQISSEGPGADADGKQFKASTDGTPHDVDADD